MENRTDSTLHEALLDANGNAVDRATVNQRAADAYRSKYGKLERRLHEKLQAADPDEEFTITVWLSGIDHEAARKAVDQNAHDTPEAARKALSAEFLDRIGTVTRQFSSKLSSVDDVTVRSADRGGAFVDADATPAGIRAVETFPAVKRVFHLPQTTEPNIDSATKTYRTYSEHDTTYNASGYPVGQGEARPDNTSHVNLAGSNWTDTGLNSHSTWVMEAMASNEDNLPGAAYAADVYHADDILSRFDSKMDWFDNNGVCGVNFSWSTENDDRVMGGWDFKFGQQVYHRFLNMVVAAGNCNESPDSDSSSEVCEVSSPALGFNTTAVGGMTDSGDSIWSNDEWVSGEWSYLNPYSENADSASNYYPHTKPEVSAIAADISTPSTATGKTGTSFAAPG